MSSDTPSLFEVPQSADGFEAFWQVYPRRVGRMAAEKAFKKALRVATVAEILAGVERYISTKPAYADWCHPRTFLTQGRWMDEVEPPARGRRSAIQGVTPCQHTPRCASFTACRDRYLAEAKRDQT